MSTRETDQSFFFLPSNYIMQNFNLTFIRVNLINLKKIRVECTYFPLQIADAGERRDICVCMCTTYRYIEQLSSQDITSPIKSTCNTINYF